MALKASQIKVGDSYSERLVEDQLAIFLAVINDQKNRLSDDLVIDTRTTLDGGLLVLLKTPGDYDSLLGW